MQMRKKQILSEAIFEIQKHEKKAFPTEDHIRGLKGHIQSQEWISGVLIEGMQNPDESRIFFVKRYPIVNWLYDKTVGEEFMKWKPETEIMNLCR